MARSTSLFSSTNRSRAIKAKAVAKTPRRSFEPLEDRRLLSGFLQADLTPGRDTFVHIDFPTTNFGDVQELSISRDPSRSLLYFDLGEVPYEARLQSAFLCVEVLSSSGARIGVHAAQSVWSEFNTTWNNAPASSSTCFSQVVASPGWTLLDVTDLVQSWVDGARDNYGLALEIESIGYGHATIASRESGSNAPQLRVAYKPEVIFAGHVTYDDVTNWSGDRPITAPVPVRQAEVWLLDDQGNRLSETSTDEDGFYVFDPRECFADRQYRVGVLAKAEGVRVLDGTGDVWLCDSLPRTINRSGECTANIAIPWNVGCGAWNILDSIHSARQVLGEAGFDQQLLDGLTIYSPGTVPDDVSHYRNRTIQFHPTNKDAYADGAVLHEYAHFVADVAAFATRTPGGTHLYFQSVAITRPDLTPQECEHLSFAEGWASFLAGAVRFRVSGQVPFRIAHQYVMNLESGYLVNEGVWLGRLAEVLGPASELAVAGCLWDLFDGLTLDTQCDVDWSDQQLSSLPGRPLLWTQDPFVIPHSFDRIWRVLVEAKPNSISEFWQAWCDPNVASADWPERRSRLQEARRVFLSREIAVGLPSMALFDRDGAEVTNAFDFGRVPLAASETATFTIRNTGSGPLRIRQIECGDSNDRFQLVGFPNGPGSADDWIVPADQSRAFVVQFSPLNNATALGTLTLTTSDVEHPVQIVSLLGLGSSYERYTPPASTVSISPSPDGPSTTVLARLALPTSGHRVVEWGEPIRNGNKFTVNAKTEQPSFSALPVIVEASNVYSLGALSEGNYTFEFNAWGSLVASAAFTCHARTLSVGDVQMIEGNAGLKDLEFTIVLSVASSRPISVNYVTAPGTAEAGSDYVSVQGTATFAPGATEAKIRAPIVGEPVVEPNEQFVLNLSSPEGATLLTPRAAATILDDDSMGQLAISGSVWNDSNGNSLREAGETGLAGQRVFLDNDEDGQCDPLESYVLTAADGTYTLPGLGPGACTVARAADGGQATFPWAEQGRLASPYPAAGAGYGTAIALMGNSMLVGVPGDSTYGGAAGMAYLVDAVTGQLLQTFHKPDPRSGELFGFSVAALNGLVLIGCPGARYAGDNPGAAYLFDASTGNLLKTFVDPYYNTKNDSQEFGHSVALMGNMVLIGAPRHTLTSPGLIGKAGAAYLFDTQGAIQSVLESPGICWDEYFGATVAAVGNRWVIGAPQDLYWGARGPGHVYVFDAAGNCQRSLVDPIGSTGDRFGWSLAGAGDNILVGAPGSERAYLYRADNGALLKTLVPGASSGGFGTVVAASSNLFVVGSPYDSARASGGGAAYVFSAATGTLLQTIVSRTAVNGDRFGAAVACSDTRLAVGVPGQDGDGADAGAVHVFARPAGSAPLAHRVVLGEGQSRGGIDFGSCAALPELRIEDATGMEGDSGNRGLAFRVTLSSPSSAAVSFHYATVPCTAGAADFLAASGSLTIPAGQLAATISVSIFGDATAEWDEMFYLVADGPSGCLLARETAQGWIQSDDGNPGVLTTTLPNLPVGDPDISGSWVVWEETRDGNTDIFARNLATSEERRITSDPAAQVRPRIGGNWIAWEDYRNAGATGQRDILGYDLDTGSEFLVSSDSADEILVGVDATANGGIMHRAVAFRRKYHDIPTGETASWRPHYNLWVYDRATVLATGSTTQTVSNATNFSAGTHAPLGHVAEVDFGGGLLAWSEFTQTWNGSYWVQGTRRLRKLQLGVNSSPVEIASGTAADSYAIAADTNRFAWICDDASGDPQVQLWDNGTIRTVATGVDTDLLALDNNDLVFRHEYGAELHTWDLSTSALGVLSDRTTFCSSIRVDGDGVVWRGQNVNQSGFQINYAFIHHPDLLVLDQGLRFSKDAVNEGESVDLAVAFKNASATPLTAPVTLRLYAGDPRLGGQQLASTVCSGGLAAYGVANAVFTAIAAPTNASGQATETQHWFVSVETTGYDNPLNNRAGKDITVRSADIDGPVIRDVVVAATAAPIGFAIPEFHYPEDNPPTTIGQYFSIAWTLEDPSGISGTRILVDGAPVSFKTLSGQSPASYKAVVGPMTGGPHRFAIQATDGDPSPATSEYQGAFEAAVVASEICGTFWNDADESRAYDTGEAGVAGQQVQLYRMLPREPRDQSHVPTGSLLLKPALGQSLFQSFSPTVDELAAVELLLYADNDAPAAGVEVGLRVRAQAIDGAILGTATAQAVPPLDRSEPLAVRFTFPSPLTVAAGGNYVLEWFSPSGGEGIAWALEEGNPYPRGQAATGGGALFNADFGFATFGPADEPVLVAAAATDAQGHYSFSELPAGRYRLVEMLTPGWRRTTAAAGPRDVELALNQAVAARFGIAGGRSDPPSDVDLAEISDTGAASNDNLTRLNNDGPSESLQFLVHGTVPGARVAVYANGVLLGEAVATSTDTTVVSDGVLVLDDGDWTITARQTQPDKIESADSPSIAVAIDRVAPRVSIGQPSVIATAGEPIRYTVLYIDAHLAANPLDASALAVLGTETATAELSLAAGAGNSCTVALDGIAGDGMLGISLLPLTLSDLAGNYVSQAIESELALVDDTPPSLAIEGPSAAVTLCGPILYTVVCGDNRGLASSLDAQDVVLLREGTVDASISVVRVSQSAFQVVLDAVHGEGSVSIAVARAALVDWAGNGSVAASSAPAHVVARRLTFDAPAASESSAPGAWLGTFATIASGPAAGPFTYEFVPGDGDADNSAFLFDGDALRTRFALDYETKPTYSIRVQCTDRFGLAVEEQFLVRVLDVNEPPALDVAELARTLPEDSSTSGRIPVASFAVLDDDLGENRVDIAGPNASFFEIDGNILFLKAGAVLDFESRPRLEASLTVDDPALGSGVEGAYPVLLQVTNANDPPVVLPLSVSLHEDSQVPITLAASDVDGDALTYILVTQPEHGRLIGAGSDLVYRPEDNYGGPDSFTFRVSDGLVQSETATVTIGVTSLNDAPVLNGANNFTPIHEDQTNNGQLVSTLIDGKVADVDAGAKQGIAIYSVVGGNGQWEYYTSATAGWQAVGSVSTTASLLLRSTDRIRFTPNGTSGGAASLSFRAWDQTAGMPGSKVPVNPNGGTTAFSAAAARTWISVTSVNDAPVLGGANNFTSIHEDQANNGQLVSTLIDGKVADVDAGAKQGIAIYSVVGGNGQWEYYTSAAAGWQAVGSVSTTASLLLRSTDRIRFAPNGTSGGAASLSFRAWDQTTGTPGSKVPVNPNGGTTAFSATAARTWISVTSLNDAPVLGGANNFTSIHEDQANNGQLVSTLIDGKVADVDAGAKQGIAIYSVVGGIGQWEYYTSAAAGWQAVGSVSTTASLLLRSTDRIRFTPNGTSGGAASLSFRAWDRTSGTPGSKVPVNPNGGTTAFSAAAARTWISVTSVNDAPVLGGANNFTPIASYQTDNLGDLVSTLIQGKVLDADIGPLQGIAITSLSSSRGTWQYSTNGGANWIGVGSVSTTQALLLRSTDRIRFVPSFRLPMTASISFRAWDRSSGTVGAKVSTAINGGTTAFSTMIATSGISVRFS